MTMMTNPTELLKTVYLGDRACKGLTIDSWGKRLVLRVSCISRIRSESGEWQFYTDEDIPDGLLVFTGLDSIEFAPPGHVPNDAINSVDVITLSSDPVAPLFLFQISVGSSSEKGKVTEVTIKVVAQDVHLENPSRPGIVVR